MLEQQPAVQRGAAAVRRLEKIDQDTVRMQLRITFAGATVGEVRPQEAELCAVLPVDAVAAEASEARMGAEAAARTLQAQDHAVPGRISVPASEQ